MIKRIDKITIYVNSQDEAKDFWINKMGFIVSYEQKMGPEFTWVEVSPEGDNLTTLILYPKALMLQQKPEMVSHPNIIFSTAATEACWNELKEKKVELEPIQLMPYGKIFQFMDNDNNKYLIRGN